MICTGPTVIGAAPFGRTTLFLFSFLPHSTVFPVCFYVQCCVQLLYKALEEYSIKVVSLLVIKDNIWKPDLFGRNIKCFHTTIFKGIPA